MAGRPGVQYLESNSDLVSRLRPLRSVVPGAPVSEPLLDSSAAAAPVSWESDSLVSSVPERIG